MKKSIFKRAIASASVVPVALAQCLTVANAADVSNIDLADNAVVTAANTNITLNEKDGLLYIVPNDADEYYGDSVDEATKLLTVYEDSTWNQLVFSKLTTGKTSGTIEIGKYFDTIISKTGNYKDVTKALLDNVHGVDADGNYTKEPVYTVDRFGNITMKIVVDDITPTFTANGKNTIGGALKDLAEQYNAPELEVNDDIFGDLKIGGEFTITFDGSALQDATNMKANVKFVPLQKLDGTEVYNGAGVIDYAYAAFNALKSNAKSAVDDVQAKYGIDTSSAYKQIDDSVAYYEKQLNRAKKAINKAGSFNTNGVKKYATSKDAIAAFKSNSYAQKLENKFNKQIPASGADAAQSPAFNKAFDKALTFANAIADPYVIDITADQLGAFVDDITDVTIEAANGKATITGKFTDAEKSEVETFFNDTYLPDNYADYVFKDSYKQFTVDVDFSTIEQNNGGSASVDVKIKRVVEAQPKEAETTTSTSTTQSTATETSTTSTSTTESTETSTSTTESTSTETSTTSTSTTESTETSTSTTESTSTETSTTSTSTTESTETSTSTTSTSTTSTSTTSTSTSTTETSTTETTTTTTAAVTSVKYSYEVTADTGYYLSVQKSFNKNQIKSVKLISEVVQMYIYDNGDYVKNEDGSVKTDVVNAKETKDVTDSVDFGTATPANVFEYKVVSFKHDLALYASEDIKDAFGNVITLEGNKIQSDDNTFPVATVYVGLKGDANLDFAVDSKDATDVLDWYSDRAIDSERTRFSRSSLLDAEDADQNLDQLAAFLADVTNEIDPNNYVVDKMVRTINSTDASYILAMYSEQSTTTEKGAATRELWNKVLEGSPYVIND